MRHMRFTVLSILVGVGLLASACGLSVAAPTTAPAAPSTAAAASATPQRAATTSPTPAPQATTRPSEAAATTEVVVFLVEDNEYGPILADKSGRALYIHTQDLPGLPACINTCLVNWPAFTVPEGVTPAAGPGISGRLGVLTRQDGTRQVTVNDQPLYYAIEDSEPGATNGQGIANIWFLADAAGLPIMAPG